MKIVFTDTDTILSGNITLDAFKEYGEVVGYGYTPYDKVAERIKDADAVICNKTLLDSTTMADAKNLKYIGVLATGYNNIDMDYANAHGITVTNAGSYSTDAVAQHTFAFILNHFSRVADYSKFVRDGNWIRSKIFTSFEYPADEIAGKTIGVIGYGNIAKATIKIAQAFNMKVLVHTRTVKEDNSVTFVDFDTLLKESDIVTIHCPLTDKTKDMFNKEAFDKCKKGMYLVNTARGPIVNEKALFDALEDGRLSGAGIDVLDKEPMSADCILYKAKNIDITPHVAWAPYKTRIRLIDIVFNNLKGYVEGSPQNVVSSF